MARAAKQHIPPLHEQILFACALITLAAGLPGVASEIREELKTGMTYSPAVVFGDGTQYSRESSQGLYWIFIGLYALVVVINAIVVCACSVEVVQQRRRRNLWLDGRRKVIVDNLTFFFFAGAYAAVVISIGCLIAKAARL